MPAPPAPASPDYSHLSGSLRPLAARGVLKHYRKGARLIEEGDYGDTLYIVLSGQLRVFTRGEGDRELTFGTYGPGEYVGEMSLDGGRRSASVEAAQTSVCAMVTRTTLLLHIGEHPEFALELLAKVIWLARTATLSARDLALTSAYSRLKGLLETLAVTQPDGRRVIVAPPTHRATASLIGCTPGMITKMFKQLEFGGYVTGEGRALCLARPLPARW